MMSDKREELLSYLIEKGFKPRNFDVLARDSNSIYNQFFDANGFLQVSDIIIRITDSDQFLLTVKEQYADQKAFDDMMSEVYDALKMNRINVDRDQRTEFDLIDFTNNDPTGQYETIFTGAERRPMFGSGIRVRTRTDDPCYCGSSHCQTCTHTYNTPVDYVFWIAFPGTEVYQGTNCVATPDQYCNNHSGGHP